MKIILWKPIKQECGKKLKGETLLLRRMATTSMHIHRMKETNQKEREEMRVERKALERYESSL